MTTHRKLRMGMIGGGQGSFIGAIHRIAARLDNHIDLVAGCFSSDPKNSRITGNHLCLDPARVYDNFKIMIESEKKMPQDKRIDFVSIVTPNHVHFEPLKMAMENGFHVIIDKPLCLNIAEAKQLIKIQQKTKRIVCLTHTYTGYPMIKEAKEIVSKGTIGAIKKVYVEYPQGWLSQAIEKTNNKQAKWRLNPKQSGKGGAIGDIGTHAFNLAEYVTGKQVIAMCAHLQSVVKGRVLDDDAMMLLKFENNISGVLIATQIAAGEENNVKIRVYGDKGSIEWQQEDANTLQLKILNQPKQILRAGNAYNSFVAQFNTRTPAGHPEGYLEAFANLYKNFALKIQCVINNVEASNDINDFPTLNDGLRGMAFIENCILSHHSNKKWTNFKL